MGSLSPIRYIMSQIDNINESKESRPRTPPLSQSIEIKFTTRPAIVTVSLKANEKTERNASGHLIFFITQNLLQIF